MKGLINFVKSLAPNIIFQLLENGVVERKNRSLEELARTLLNENNLPKYFWADEVSIANYVLNRVLIRSILKKNSL